MKFTIQMTSPTEGNVVSMHEPAAYKCSRLCRLHCLFKRLLFCQSLWGVRNSTCCHQLLVHLIRKLQSCSTCLPPLQETWDIINRSYTAPFRGPRTTKCRANKYAVKLEHIKVCDIVLLRANVLQMFQNLHSFDCYTNDGKDDGSLSQSALSAAGQGLHLFCHDLLDIVVQALTEQRIPCIPLYRVCQTHMSVPLPVRILPCSCEASSLLGPVRDFI